jgi:alanyl-tRNA synthetase
MTSQQIRSTFLQYFEQRGHTIVRSSSLIPEDDPTLLFTNAGMNQFKRIFLGLEKTSYTRAASTQKCIRVSGKHNDLEDVGKDTYHNTFFEMLGNWSFGDYYKEEAISFAWDLLTNVYGLPPERLFATVYEEDDEAFCLWPRVTGIPPSRVMRFGKKENFWEMGEVGPCGPCSEIHMDLGEGEGCGRSDCGPNCSYCGERTYAGGGYGARFIELWNLVFIQFNRRDDGILQELPEKHVDTGMGFERITAVLQQTTSNYETDLFAPILRGIEEITGRSYREGTPAEQVAFRVIADHARAMTCAIADGVIPSNEGRGYVIRRLLRRAARFGRNLGMHEPFIYRLASHVVDLLGEAYPEVIERAGHVTLVMKSEEEHFGRTLDRGIERFEEAAADVTQAGRQVIGGRDAFILYDTYGFPIDLTQLMAEERGLTVDLDGFNEEMERQRERSRRGSKAISTPYVTSHREVQSEFIGYGTTASDAEVVSCVALGAEGAVGIILNRTPFYAEAGGQVGDRGTIVGRGFEVNVEETVKVGDATLHKGRTISGEIEGIRGDVWAEVDGERRQAVARNHTATHLLHAALRRILGRHVHQAGSLVAPERLRFDFAHFTGVTSSQRQEIEDLVNEKIVENIPVLSCETTLNDAKARGAIALFGEKYGERVRVIQIGDYSLELCGGTHVETTGTIGYFRLTEEGGIAAGVRRVEALTALMARRQAEEERQILRQISTLLDNVPPSEITGRLEHLLLRLKTLEKAAEELQRRLAKRDTDDLIARHAKYVDGITIVAARVPSSEIEELRQLADALRERLTKGVGVLGTVIGEKATLLAVVTDDLIHDRGLRAGDLVKEIATLIGGGGGGRPHMAQAGGGDPIKLDTALMSVETIVKRRLSGV